MKFNENSFTAKLVKFSYSNTGLGKSLCQYFWQSVFAWLFSPFIGIYYIFDSEFFKTKYDRVISNDHEPFTKKIFVIVILSAILYGVIIALTALGGVIGIENYLLAFIVGLIVAAIAIALIIGLFASGAYVRESYIKRKKSKWGDIEEKEPNIVLEYLKAKKRKICPLIEWEKN